MYVFCLKKFEMFCIANCFQAFMEDVDSRQAALASIKNKAEELIKQAGDKEDMAVQGQI